MAQVFTFLKDGDNVTCEMWFVNGELHRLIELD